MVLATKTACDNGNTMEKENSNVHRIGACLKHINHHQITITWNSKHVPWPHASHYFLRNFLPAAQPLACFLPSPRSEATVPSSEETFLPLKLSLWCHRNFKEIAMCLCFDEHISLELSQWTSNFLVQCKVSFLTAWLKAAQLSAESVATKSPALQRFTALCRSRFQIFDTATSAAQWLSDSLASKYYWWKKYYYYTVNR